LSVRKSSLKGRFKSGLREFLSIFKELLSVKVVIATSMLRVVETIGWI
jgi:hypothetical protein